MGGFGASTCLQPLTQLSTLIQLYTELEVDQEMERGLFPALISISRKFMPVTRRLISNTRDSMATVLNRTLTDDSRGEERAGDVELSRVPHNAGPSSEGLRKRL